MSSLMLLEAIMFEMSPPIGAPGLGGRYLRGFTRVLGA